MEFPPFDHLRFYEGVHDVPLNISYSNIQGFTLGEFHKALPGNLDLNWTDERGPPELRRLIARRTRVPIERILVTSGATEANFLANAALVRPKDRVVVDSPIYSPLRDCAAGMGGDVIPVGRDCKSGWSLDLDRIQTAAGGKAKLLVFANLNNPTSSAIGRSEMRELADIAEECNGYVLVDETFRELAFRRRVRSEDDRPFDRHQAGRPRRPPSRLDRRASATHRTVQGREGLHDDLRLLRLPRTRDLGPPAMGLLSPAGEANLGWESKTCGGRPRSDAFPAWRDPYVGDRHVPAFRCERDQTHATPGPQVQDRNRRRTILRIERSLPARPRRECQRTP